MTPTIRSRLLIVAVWAATAACGPVPALQPPIAPSASPSVATLTPLTPSPSPLAPATAGTPAATAGTPARPLVTLTPGLVPQQAAADLAERLGIAIEA